MQNSISLEVKMWRKAVRTERSGHRVKPVLPEPRLLEQFVVRYLECKFQKILFIFGISIYVSSRKSHNCFAPFPKLSVMKCATSPTNRGRTQDRKVHQVSQVKVRPQNGWSYVRTGQDSRWARTARFRRGWLQPCANWELLTKKFRESSKAQQRRHHAS
jgi:hypothetical protein